MVRISLRRASRAGGPEKGTPLILMPGEIVSRERYHQSVMSPFPRPPQSHSVMSPSGGGGGGRLPISSLDVQPNPHHGGRSGSHGRASQAMMT